MSHTKESLEALENNKFVEWTHVCQNRKTKEYDCTEGKKFKLTSDTDGNNLVEELFSNNSGKIIFKIEKQGESRYLWAEKDGEYTLIQTFNTKKCLGDFGNYCREM